MRINRCRRNLKELSRSVRRITAMLGNGRSITLTGENLTLGSVIESLESLLAQACDTREGNLRLSTVLRKLRDMPRA